MCAYVDVIQSTIGKYLSKFVHTVLVVLSFVSLQHPLMTYTRDSEDYEKRLHFTICNLYPFYSNDERRICQLNYRILDLSTN